MNPAHEFLTRADNWKQNRDSLMNALHFINATKGRGSVVSFSGPGVKNDAPGLAYRKITGGIEIRPFSFRLFWGRDGKPRIRALGRTVTLES